MILRYVGSYMQNRLMHNLHFVNKHCIDTLYISVYLCHSAHDVRIRSEKCKRPPMDKRKIHCKPLSNLNDSPWGSYRTTFNCIYNSVKLQSKSDRNSKIPPTKLQNFKFSLKREQIQAFLFVQVLVRAKIIVNSNKHHRS